MPPKTRHRRINKELEQEIEEWYKTHHNERVTIEDIINRRRSDISLRKIEYFINVFSVNNRVLINNPLCKGDKIDVYSAYKDALKGYHMNYFNPFCRAKKKMLSQYIDDNPMTMDTTNAANATDTTNTTDVTNITDKTNILVQEIKDNKIEDISEIKRHNIDDMIKKDINDVYTIKPENTDAFVLNKEQYIQNSCEVDNKPVDNSYTLNIEQFIDNTSPFIDTDTNTITNTCIGTGTNNTANLNINTNTKKLGNSSTTSKCSKLRVKKIKKPALCQLNFFRWAFDMGIIDIVANGNFN